MQNDYRKRIADDILQFRLKTASAVLIEGAEGAEAGTEEGTAPAEGETGEASAEGEAPAEGAAPAEGEAPAEDAAPAETPAE